MPSEYTDYQFRLEVFSPVAADSPFDSDTLWGRILCALMLGGKVEQELAAKWLSELSDRPPDWFPPLLVSEGFQCDVGRKPWLPIPLAVKHQIEKMKLRRANGEEVPRKELKKIEWVPLKEFAKLCAWHIDVEELLALRDEGPRIQPALQPHLAMDRRSGTGLEGQLYMRALHVYLATGEEENEDEEKSPPEDVPRERNVPGQAGAHKPQGENRSPTPSMIVFFLRLRDSQDAVLLNAALERICDEGWGNAKSRGLGRIKFKECEQWQPPWPVEPSDGFVSLSHFCPASGNPTVGYWKIQPKHPVPAQFVDGRRVALGERSEWRVKSFLRLRAGSCFRIAPGDAPTGWYGRMLKDLVTPAQDAQGRLLPTLYHYALAFRVPIRWPFE